LDSESFKALIEFSNTNGVKFKAGVKTNYADILAELTSKGTIGLNVEGKDFSIHVDSTGSLSGQYTIDDNIKLGLGKYDITVKAPVDNMGGKMLQQDMTGIMLEGRF